MPGVGIWPSDLMIPFKPAYSFSWALELFGREPVSCRSSLAGSKEPFSWGSICTSQPILWWCLHSSPRNSIPAAPSSSGMLYCHTQAKGQAPSQPMLRLIQASQEYQTSQDKIKSQTRFLKDSSPNPDLWRCQRHWHTTELPQSADPPRNCVVQCSLNWHLHADP